MTAIEQIVLVANLTTRGVRVWKIEGRRERELMVDLISRGQTFYILSAFQMPDDRVDTFPNR